MRMIQLKVLTGYLVSDEIGLILLFLNVNYP